MEPTCLILKPFIDSKGFLSVDGVKIGKVIELEGELIIQFCDKDFERSVHRGTRFIGVKLKDLQSIILATEGQPPPR